MVFYLKINRNERYTFRNLQNWINIMEAIPDSEYYILCDNERLKEMVLNQIVFKKEQIDFLESCKCSSQLDYIVGNITDKYWRNAGYAHMTTFLHSKQNGFPCFWNIDADDTCFCLAPERVAEMFDMVEYHAKINQVNIISLDMWTSRAGGNHWSFGITYTDNSIDWFEVMRQYCLNEELKSRQIRNIDGFFSCLKNCTDLKIETFYVENLKFIHYSDDFFKRPHASGFFHWKKGKLILPILLYCLGIESKGIIEIPESVIKFDMKIMDQESTVFLLEYALDIERKLLES